MFWATTILFFCLHVRFFYASTAFQRKVFKVLEGHSYTLKQLVKDVAIIKNRLTLAAGNNASLLVSTGSNDGTVNQAAAFCLPLSTEAELSALEDSINDASNYEALVSYCT